MDNKNCDKVDKQWFETNAINRSHVHLLATLDTCYTKLTICDKFIYARTPQKQIVTYYQLASNLLMPQLPFYVCPFEHFIPKCILYNYFVKKFLTK